MDNDLREELRRKNLCYICKEPWALGHRYYGKGKAHHMEAYSADDSESEFLEQQTDLEESEYEDVL